MLNICVNNRANENNRNWGAKTPVLPSIWFSKWHMMQSGQGTYVHVAIQDTMEASLQAERKKAIWYSGSEGGLTDLKYWCDFVISWRAESSVMRFFDFFTEEWQSSNEQKMTQILKLSPSVWLNNELMTHETMLESLVSTV